ncbi:MAG: hypothetical protein ACE5FT_01760 [Candidatus Nanoarchaeia archaeon]
MKYEKNEDLDLQLHFDDKAGRDRDIHAERREVRGILRNYLMECTSQSYKGGVAAFLGAGLAASVAACPPPPIVYRNICANDLDTRLDTQSIGPTVATTEVAGSNAMYQSPEQRDIQSRRVLRDKLKIANWVSVGALIYRFFNEDDEPKCEQIVHPPRPRRGTGPCTPSYKRWRARALRRR